MTKDELIPFLSSCQLVMDGPLALFALKQTFFDEDKQSFVVLDEKNHFHLMLSPFVSINEDMEIEDNPKLHIKNNFDHFYEACADKVLSFHHSSILTKYSHTLRQMGLGLTWQGTPSDKEKFNDVLVEFGCHQTIAQAITNDLMKANKRQTTVRYQLKDKLPLLQKKASNLGVKVSVCLPSVHLSEAPLELKLKQLTKQFGK